MASRSVHCDGVHEPSSPSAVVVTVHVVAARALTAPQEKAAAIATITNNSRSRDGRRCAAPLNMPSPLDQPVQAEASSPDGRAAYDKGHNLRKRGY
jgi:hypothetical protein